MPANLDISRHTTSDMTNKVDNWAVNPMQTDGIGDQDETEWINNEWTTQWGYFNQIPELKSAILMKAIWDVGKGFQTSPENQAILNHISGWGKDTFEDILFNMVVTMRVGGDSYAEIVRDDDTGEIINLKPLDPSTIKIIVNGQGIIKRYEQISKHGGKGGNKKFKPSDILHFSHNRLADQIHGISDIKSLELVIKAEAESFEDMMKINHRQLMPFIIFKLKTDDQTKIDQIVNTIDSKVINKRENLYIPDDENIVSFEIVQVSVSQIVMEWRTSLTNKFYRALGLPLVLFGSSNSTESGGKMEVHAHEQVFEYDQKKIERQLFEQLGILIDLISPTKLLQDLQTDQSKDANQGFEIQPNDLTAGRGR